MYSDILSSTPIQCGSSCDTRLVHGITRRLARAAKAATDGSTDGFKWCVAVANSDEVNAMCAPGGRIIITTGLLDLLSRNTEEVAIVLGHEISHAVCRHAAEGRFIRRLMMLLTSALQIIIGGGIGWNSGFTLGVVLPYSRKLELEADYIGTLLCADAGYNPQAAVSVFRKLEQASGEPDVWGRKFFSTHPLGDVRLKNVHSWLPFCVQRYHASPHVAHTIDTHPHTRGA